MDRYDYWIDGNGTVHKISEMDSNYIRNCLRQLEMVRGTWRGITPEDLNKKDLESSNKPLSKAWFAFDGEKYMEVLTEELENRET